MHTCPANDWKQAPCEAFLSAELRYAPKFLRTLGSFSMVIF